MSIRARHARQIRHGILLAREVMARRRMRPRNLTFEFDAPLWELAYQHEMRKMMRIEGLPTAKGLRHS